MIFYPLIKGGEKNKSSSDGLLFFRLKTQIPIALPFSLYLHPSHELEVLAVIFFSFWTIPGGSDARLDDLT